MKQYEKILFSLERGSKYKHENKQKLLKVALEFVDFSEKTKDWRYLNLALKIRDVINKNKQLDFKIQKSIKKINSF